MIHILYFASLRETLNCATETMDETPSSVFQLFEQLSSRDEVWKQALSGKVLVAVNQQMAQVTQLLKDGDEVGLFPPVTGG